MLTVKNLVKWIIVQIEIIRIKGHWIAGGNIAFPFLMAMLLWYVPRRAKEFTGSYK